MIRELSTNKASQKGFYSTNSRVSSKTKQIKTQTPNKKQMRNELNINIPGYLMDKNSEKNLNKSNEFTNLNTIERRTPMHSAGNRVRTTTAKDKKYIDNIFSSNTNEAMNLPSFDNERTLDTTNPTKHTLINNRDKNISQQNYQSTSNVNNTSPNGKIERTDFENFNNSSYQNNSNNNISSGKITGNNQSSGGLNSGSGKNLNLNLTLKNSKKNINMYSANSKSSEKLNNSIGAAYKISKGNRNIRDLENSYSKSPSSNTLKRSYDAASKGKSTLRSKSAKAGKNMISSKSPAMGSSKSKFGIELTDGDNFQENVYVLEKLINEIKSKGFDKYKNLIDEKMQMKKILEVRVENYQKLLNMKNAEKKSYGQNNSKIENDSELFKKLAERCIRENPTNARTIVQLKREISDMKETYTEKNKETQIIMNSLCEDQQMVQAIKEEIKKVNKMTSELSKEKDSMRNGINLLNKHVEILKEKILEEKQKSKEFIKNVSCFVDESLKKKDC